MENSHIIQSGQLSLEYFVFGKGTKTVICFHGHGRSVDDFRFVEHHGVRVIAIHLFHHGRSFFPEDRIEPNPLHYREFKTLFSMILEAEMVDHFHLFAFSQGGRFTLALLPDYIDRIETVTLISPDGMDNNSFYNWSSRQKWARALFTRWEAHPSRVIRMSKIAQRLGLMRPKVGEFVRQFASDKKTFKRASDTWRTFRNVLPDEDKIAAALHKKQIPFRIIMGTYDQVIRPKQAYAFAKRIGRPDCVKEINNGHNFFKESAIKRFEDLLLYRQ